MSRDAAADAAAILRGAMAAADAAGPVRTALARAPELQRDSPVSVIAVGKAACTMSRAAAAVLGPRIGAQLIVVPHGSDCDGAVHAAHPVPDASSEAAGRAVRAMIERTPAHGLVLVLLSGGTSSLTALPADAISIDAYGACVALLQRAGADIGELNTVRKHLDLLKGGRLAALAAPRRVLGLILSDVIGDPLDVIASGPLSPDPTTFDDAIGTLRRRGVWEHCAESVRATLQRGAAGLEPDTPKRAAELAHVRTVVIGGNALARDGAADSARQLGYAIELVDTPMTGEARIAASHFATHARARQRTLAPGDPPLCIIAGGETTVTVRGSGRGGRNQEFVLAAALTLENATGITIGAAGTDGIDGDSDAAGAIADAGMIELARLAGLDARSFLDDNDSHSFFHTAGGQLITGATGTNVMDMQIALIHRGTPD